MIKGKRIKQTERHLSYIQKGATIVFGVSDIIRFLERIGEHDWKRLENGESIAPNVRLGPISKYNMLPRNVVNKDIVETGTRIRESIIPGRNRGYTEEFEYHPISFFAPPDIKFKIINSSAILKMIVSPPFQYLEENEETLVHVINLFLEVFGECQVLTNEFIPIIKAPVRNLSWEILPKGRNSWSEIQKSVHEILTKTAQAERNIIQERFRFFNDHNPEFVAIGRASFRGYIIFAFPSKNLYFLESAFNGNATYVLRDGWEELSHLSKTEILSNQLHAERVIHRENWKSTIYQLLKNRH